MNLQHLKYAVEVEKTGSITQAAENLYILAETEDTKNEDKS